jgi:hypothetical protein
MFSHRGTENAEKNDFVICIIKMIKKNDFAINDFAKKKYCKRVLKLCDERF